MTRLSSSPGGSRSSLTSTASTDLQEGLQKPKSCEHLHFCECAAAGSYLACTPAWPGSDTAPENRVPFGSGTLVEAPAPASALACSPKAPTALRRWDPAATPPERGPAHGAQAQSGAHQPPPAPACAQQEWQRAPPGPPAAPVGFCTVQHCRDLIYFKASGAAVMQLLTKSSRTRTSKIKSST